MATPLQGALSVDVKGETGEGSHVSIGTDNTNASSYGSVAEGPKFSLEGGWARGCAGHGRCRADRLPQWPPPAPTPTPVIHGSWGTAVILESVLNLPWITGVEARRATTTAGKREPRRASARSAVGANLPASDPLLLLWSSAPDL